MYESFFNADEINPKYDAPEIEGYSHLGNSSDENGEYALAVAEGFYNAHSIFIAPFFPDGDKQDELWEYRVKWAVYGIRN